MFAGYDDVAVGRDCEIKGTEVGICDQPNRLSAAFRRECEDCIVSFSVRPNPRREEQPAIYAERESARKRHDAGRENMLAGAAQLDWKGHDGACAPQTD